MLKIILSSFLILSFIYGNNVGIPNDSCALIIASRKTKMDVKAYVDENITYTKYVTLYESNNGWYAIALGFLKNHESKSIIKQWKRDGKIPNDSFCTHGDRFKKEIFIDNIYNSSPSNQSLSYKSSPSNNKKQLKCLALTWGPDVCSQSFSDYANKTNNIDDVSDIIKSPACATMITEALGEKLTQADLEIAILTGALDEGGAAGMESDNIFYNVLGGFAHLYSFAIKVSVYESCMNK